MVLRPLHFAAVLLAGFLAMSGVGAQIGPPAEAPTGDLVFTPPCCDPPEIIGALSTRPPGETRAQLAAWLSGRFRSQGAAAADLDIQALTGACEGDCPTSYRAALETLRELRGLDVDLDDHGDPCCTGPSAATSRGARPARPRGTSAQARAMSAQVDAFYTDSILRRMIEAPGDVAIWLPAQVGDIPARRLQLLRHRLAGRCPGASCTQALATGLDIIREDLERRQRHAARNRETLARQAEADAQASENQTAILLTVVASAVTSIATLIGVVITLIWSGRQSRRYAQSLEAWLGRLDDRLGVLASRKPRRSNPQSGRGAVRVVRGRAKAEK